MENYQEKARENFYRNRPYGIHIDYVRKGFVLFNHYTNSLGKQETGSIEELPLEKFKDVDAIPLMTICNIRMMFRTMPSFIFLDTPDSRFPT